MIRLKRQGQLILGIILIIIIAVFSILNVTPVPINFGFMTVRWPLVIVLLGAVFIGALLMFLLTTVTHFQKRRQDKQRGEELASKLEPETVKQHNRRITGAVAEQTKTTQPTHEQKEKDDDQ